MKRFAMLQYYFLCLFNRYHREGRFSRSRSYITCKFHTNGWRSGSASHTECSQNGGKVQLQMCSTEFFGNCTSTLKGKINIYEKNSLHSLILSGRHAAHCKNLNFFVNFFFLRNVISRNFLSIFSNFRALSVYVVLVSWRWGQTWPPWWWVLTLLWWSSTLDLWSKSTSTPCFNAGMIN